MTRLLSRFFIACVLGWLTACAPTVQTFDTPHAKGRYADAPIQCVPYAREVSGIQLRGNAHTWWDKAANRYKRGYIPKPGAVLVLAGTKKMRHGHVAVVRRVVNNRMIEVTHSNWGNSRETRRMIYDNMRVEDLSALNDWSKVRFWNYHLNCFGLPYKARGFIYP